MISCNHKNTIRKLLSFSEEEKAHMILPYSHQVVFCSDCWEIVSQENNKERRKIIVDQVNKILKGH